MPNGCLMSGLFFRGIYNGKKKLPLGSFFYFKSGNNGSPRLIRVIWVSIEVPKLTRPV